MRRVVVTGIGALTPFGVGVDCMFNGLINSKSAVRKNTRLDVTEYSSQIAGLVPYGTGENEFNPNDFMEPKEQRHFDSFVIYGLAAAKLAIEDSGWMPQSDEDRYATGVLFGSGVGGVNAIEDARDLILKSGPRRISPFLVTSLIINIISGLVSIKYGYYGPNKACVTACSTGAHAIGDAYRHILFGDCDVMVCGSAEAPVIDISIAAFGQLRALSTHFNDTPELASRPWDKSHDGFVLGEGAGSLVLEEYEHAKKRGAKIYGEIVGYGCSGDGYHITAPAADGRGEKSAINSALKNANLNPSDIDYINAHGTSTPVGDAIEIESIKSIFGSKNFIMSSTKSSMGHLVGAAGSVEAIICLKSMETGIIPPTLNLNDPIDEAVGENLVANKAQEHKVNVALSNSFGFGGTNASLIFKKI